MTHWAPHALVVVVLLSATIGMFATALAQRPLSVVDEHVHFDYAVRIHDGGLPFRGAAYRPEVVDEWACGVGPALSKPCGDPTIGLDDLASGRYSTAYIHYPTYFLGAEAMRGAIETFAPDTPPLASYRAFSALCVSLGMIACALAALALGFRRWRLLAATAAPVAASMFMTMGSIVNPSSTTTLAGALIAAATILWVRRGRGFVWVALATGAASAVAVVDSIPAGGVVIAGVLAILARRRGWQLQPRWVPRLWQLGLLVAILVAPIIAWGRYIAASATISNGALFSFAAPTGRAETVIGIGRELTSLHNPWLENLALYTTGRSAVASGLRELSSGLTGWTSVLVFGAVVVCILAGSARAFRRGAPHGRIPTMTIVAAGTLLGMILYPPLLRLSNVLTFGFDYPIVDRYSIGFAPLLVLCALHLTRRTPGYAVALAASSAVTVIGLSFVWV